MSIENLRNALKGTYASKSSAAEPITNDEVDGLARHVFTWVKPDADATADVVTTAFPFAPIPFDMQIESVTWCQQVATTADGSNQATITVTHSDGAGSTKLTVAEITTSTGNGFAADTKEALTITTANEDVDEGRLLHIAITKPGTGKKVGPGTLTIVGIRK